MMTDHRQSRSVYDTLIATRLFTGIV